jgi:hypothetical protein
MELLEAKVFAEIDQRFQHTMGALERSERIRDLTSQRMDKKLLDQDEAFARIDKATAETKGQVRGIQEEMSNSLKWADGVDARLWEFRHQVEEEFRHKHTEIEAQIKDLHSKIRGLTLAHDDLGNKHQQTTRQLDGGIQDVSNQLDAVAQAHQQQFERLQRVELASGQ